jgi:large subunit ribosomal protein L22
MTTVKARALIKYLRIAPRKVRIVIDTVRDKPVREALYRLQAINKKAARLAEEAVKSALANAKVLKMDEDRLVVSEIKADGGPTFKRFMSRSMGRADRILKRTTHLTVVLEESAKKVAPPKQAAPAAEEAKPKKKRVFAAAGKGKAKK